MITATRPNEYIHITAFNVHTIEDGDVTMMIAFDSLSLFILNMKPYKKLTGETLTEFMRQAFDEIIKSGAKYSLGTLVFDGGSEEEFKEMYSNKVKVLIDPAWNKIMLEKIMPELEKSLERISRL